jgi:hypothetical protein
MLEFEYSFVGSETQRQVKCEQLTRATNTAECNLPRKINLLSSIEQQVMYCFLRRGGGGAANLALYLGLNMAH